MSKMTKKDKEQVILNLIFIVFIVSLFFILTRPIIAYPSMHYNEVCKLEFDGEDWIYDYSTAFGKTCIKLDFISLEVIDRKLLKINDKEITNKYCDFPKFFDLSKWSSSCEVYK